MLHLNNLTKEFAGKPLFTDITWHLKKGERVGLVGDNGAGKSTLMRIIAGQVEPSSGSLQFARGATTGYLPQEGLTTQGPDPLCRGALGPGGTPGHREGTEGADPAAGGEPRRRPGP